MRISVVHPPFQPCNQLDSVFWPRKIFHRMHTSFALIGFAKSSLLPFVQPLCRVFLAKKKERRKKRGRFSKCNVKRFPLNFRWNLVWKKYFIWKRGRRTWGLITAIIIYFSKREERKLREKLLKMVEFIFFSNLHFSRCSYLTIIVLLYNLISYTFFFFY